MGAILFPRYMTRRLGELILLMLVACGAWAQPEYSSVGETIYRRGVLPSGEPLRGSRGPGAQAEGEGAACFNCHRRSGLGTAEGRIVIPPITGKYLYRPDRDKLEDLDLRYVQSYKLNREPYADDAAVARAIRDGIGKGGKELNYLMPRYDLDDAAMASLIAYLKVLSKDRPPGVTDDTLHFSTIITPDADPVRRQGMLAVLQQFFSDKNEFIHGGNRTIQSSREIAYRVKRRWQLHVWELAGAPDTWEAQLRKKQDAEPVFAVISGVGGQTWEPVHRFCQQAAIPCLFPNVDLPVVAESDFYPVYFSKGVLLEAQMIAARLDESRQTSALRRVIQVFRGGDMGEQAAGALTAAMAGSPIQNVNQMIGSSAGSKELAAALHGAGAGDAVVLWLRPEDIAMLPVKPVSTAEVYLSGLMAGMESAPLSAAWRGTTRMAYPADLPEQRKFRMNFPLGWFRVKHIPVVAEQVQADTYLACGILSETLGEMLDSFVGDYLEERLEDMLSRRTITGYYPRLGLAPRQRFASKGGYIVRFAEPTGARVVADSDWIVP